MTKVCVFCGSSPGVDPAYTKAAAALGGFLAARRVTVIYGGGNVGLMGILADSVLAAGGEVIGVIPEALLAREVGHTGLTKLHVVRSMHERKALMADLADAFIALPGGFGTFEELCEIITWSQLGLHQKPCGILNVKEFYTPLLHFFDHAVSERFIRPQHRAVVLVDENIENLWEALTKYHAQFTPKWIRPEET